MAVLTDKTALAVAAVGDFLHIVDISDTSGSAAGTSKKITFANIQASLTLGSDDITNDSGVTGATVSAALDTLDAAIVAEDIWDRSGTTITPKVAGDDVSFGTGGMLDNDVVTAVALGEAGEITFDTTSQSIIGAVNEVFGDLPSAVEDRFIPTLGQTVFALSSTPSSASAFALYKNGQLRVISVDYTQVGTVLTWLDPGGETLETDDQLTARYNDTSVNGGGVAEFNKLNRTSFKGDGINDYMAISATVDLQYERTDAFSFSCWVRPETGTNSTIYSAENSVSLRGVALRWNTLQFVINIRNTITTNDLSMRTTATFAVGTWYHLVFTYDGSSSAAGVHIYVNNVDETLTTNSDTLSATILYTAGIRIGQLTGGTQAFDGNIDEFLTFDAELDSSDVLELNNMRVLTDYTALTKAINNTHIWRMGDFATSLTIDDEAGSSDGTITNTTGLALVSQAP